MTKNTRLFSNYPQLLILSILSITSFIKIVYTLEGFQAINHQQHSQDYDDLFKFYRSFKTSNNSRIVAQVGSSVELPCSLDDSSSDIVTWTRKNDYKLLTVDTSTYSSDERFRIEHVRHRDIRNLQIKSVMKSDEGIYECNLSSHPPRSIHIHLSVLEPTAEIHESPETKIVEGSILKLECKIINAIENPTFIFWYHNNLMINFADDDKLSVLTIPQQNFTRRVEESHKIPSNLVDPNNSIYRKVDDTLYRHNGNTKPLNSGSNDVESNPDTHTKSKIFTALSSSILLINEVLLKHAGNYTCQPSNARPTWIVVRVLKSGNSKTLRYFSKTGFLAILNSTSSRVSCDFRIILGISLSIFVSISQLSLNYFKI